MNFNGIRCYRRSNPTNPCKLDDIKSKFMGLTASAYPTVRPTVRPTDRPTVRPSQSTPQPHHSAPSKPHAAVFTAQGRLQIRASL